MSGSNAAIPGAPMNCPGTDSKQAGKSSACDSCPNKATCASRPVGPDPDLTAISERLKGVKHIVLVLSGKGGVGKSTVSTQVALSLAAKGLEVGLLDIDVCGPSVPRMLGLESEEIHQSGSGWQPVFYQENLAVMSIGFMLSKPDDAVIWRGPKKTAIIKSFLRDVEWGELDYLIVDSPPGTSDEHISIVQYLLGCKNLAGAVIVTTSQEVSLVDVRKEINFAHKVGLPIIGVVSNMAGFTVGADSLMFSDESGNDISEAVRHFLKQKFGDGVRAEGQLLYAEAGAAERMAEQYGVPFLGSIPQDLELSIATETGRLLEGSSNTATSIQQLASTVVLACEVKLSQASSGRAHNAP